MSAVDQQTDRNDTATPTLPENDGRECDANCEVKEL